MQENMEAINVDTTMLSLVLSLVLVDYGTILPFTLFVFDHTPPSRSSLLFWLLCEICAVCEHLCFSRTSRLPRHVNEVDCPSPHTHQSGW